MLRQFSYGIIPLRYLNQQWEVLLIQHQAGHWSFPKGHPEVKEEPKQTAVRELEEETGLKIVRFFSSEPLSETYYFMHQGQRICKTVAYFLAEVEGEVHLQLDEVAESRWVPIQEAEYFATFKEGQRLCQETYAYVKNQGIL
jgi:8-oxo-dGTP pyrophosphatase MutT (NUDIX family)